MVSKNTGLPNDKSSGITTPLFLLPIPLTTQPHTLLAFSVALLHCLPTFKPAEILTPGSLSSIVLLCVMGSIDCTNNALCLSLQNG
ncbi:hypothetical protein FKM82_024863 [Ascaphus truei]